MAEEWGFGGVEDAAKILLEIEAKLREIAAERPEGREAAEEIDKLLAKTDELELIWLDSVSHLLAPKGVSEDAVRDIVYSLEDLAAAASLCDRSIGECVANEKLMKDVDKLDEISEKLIGKRCSWLLGHVKRYTLSAAANDIAACIHRIAEFLRTAVNRRVGKCIVSEDSTPYTRFLCYIWDEASNEMQKAGRYAEEDATALIGYAERNRVEYRVGSAIGHLAKIEYDEASGQWWLEYWDDDEDVAIGLKRVLEEYGAATNCRYDIDDGRLTCIVTNPERASALLSIATSLDFRSNRPNQYYDEHELADIAANIDAHFVKLIKKSMEREIAWG